VLNYNKVECVRFFFGPLFPSLFLFFTRSRALQVGAGISFHQISSEKLGRCIAWDQAVNSIDNCDAFSWVKTSDGLTHGLACPDIPGLLIRVASYLPIVRACHSHPRFNTEHW
jgi:hypothetical protein